jgi:Ca-activated chloride channel family protein
LRRSRWILGAVAACALAQIRVDVDVVNVLCTVRDGRGALVTDLKKEDFEIRENGKPRQIRYFARETDLPLTVALLVDVSGSVRGFLKSEKETAFDFFRVVLRKQDQAMVTGFSSTIVRWRDLTGSLAALREALEMMHAVPFKGLPKDGGPVPTTLLYDAVVSTAMNQLQGVAGRKAMVVISDGIDIGSRGTSEMAVRQAQTANVIVYSICYPNEHESGCGNLTAISDPTGGRMFDLRAKTPLAEIFRTIEDELRSQYSIGFEPQNAPGDHSFHRLQVRVKRPGLRVRARRGYYPS